MKISNFSPQTIGHYVKSTDKANIGFDDSSGSTQVGRNIVKIEFNDFLGAGAGHR